MVRNGFQPTLHNDRYRRSKKERSCNILKYIEWNMQRKKYEKMIKFRRFFDIVNLTQTGENRQK